MHTTRVFAVWGVGGGGRVERRGDLAPCVSACVVLMKNCKCLDRGKKLEQKKLKSLAYKKHQVNIS